MRCHLLAWVCIPLAGWDSTKGIVNAQECNENSDCEETGCCATLSGLPGDCVEAGTLGFLRRCSTVDGCDCEYGVCRDDICSNCNLDAECASACCGDRRVPVTSCEDTLNKAVGARCYSTSGCDCASGSCENDGDPVPGVGQQGICICTEDSHCSDDEECCDDGTCEEICEKCGEWAETCNDPARPVRQGDGVDCGGSCDESICCGECDPDDDQCPDPLVCCDDTLECVTQDEYKAMSCGDPHMTGFLGQRFDFTGEDGAWYCLIADDNININMRVTSPVIDLPEITYITGLSVLSTDADGFDHSIVIEVKDPHNLDSFCPAEVSPCLADGSLRVVLDGEETLLAPGTVSLGQDMQISAANLPGACRSFGFEEYWERKQLENARHGRRLGEALSMGEWILGDPTATNMEECVEYVTRAEVEDGGLFAHQSEHASFQIVTPKATIRLSHGRLHQIAMRDTTDQFDLPDHLTWQMNMAVDHNKVSHDAKGVLGETFVPARDANGKPIMIGMEAIRGKQEDYQVEGALGMDFVHGGHTS